jgi:hypothetical protein
MTDFGESESEEDEPRPNLTLPIEEDDDDSFEAPPRLSQAFDGDGTQVSIEAPRRDFAGLGHRLSEGIRMSDRFGEGEDLDEAVRRAVEEGDDTIGMEAYVGGDDDLGYVLSIDSGSLLMNTGTRLVIFEVFWRVAELVYRRMPV